MEHKNAVAERLAKRLREARKSLGLSLEATAKLSGVSRSMLSQIERMESSPTVATLWSLTKALHVDFAGLLDSDRNEKSNIIELMRARRTPTIDSQGEGCRIRILSPPNQAGKTEVYEIQFTQNGALASAPHSRGCVEHLSVLKGKLEVIAGEESAELEKGDTLRYAADCAHSIKNPGAAATAILIVYNS